MQLFTYSTFQSVWILTLVVLILVWYILFLIFDIVMNAIYNMVKKDKSIMYMWTQVTSLHSYSLDSKCLVTFLRECCLVYPQDLAYHLLQMKKSLQLKSVTDSGLWDVILGSSTDLSWAKQEAADDKTTIQSFKIYREWWLVVSQALWNLIHCKYKSNFPILSGMGRDCCREWQDWATSSFWSCAFVVNIFKAIFSAFITHYMFRIGNKNIFCKYLGSEAGIAVLWSGVVFLHR